MPASAAPTSVGNFRVTSPHLPRSGSASASLHKKLEKISLSAGGGGGGGEAKKTCGVLVRRGRRQFLHFGRRSRAASKTTSRGHSFALRDGLCKHAHDGSPRLSLQARPRTRLQSLMLSSLPGHLVACFWHGRRHVSQSMH